MKTLPVLDVDQLREMTGGDAAFQQELFRTYRASVTNVLSRLRAALAASDMAQIVRQAHALKGASLNVGATAIGHCAGAIEIAARAGDPARVLTAARSLDAEEAALWAELDRL